MNKKIQVSLGRLIYKILLPARRFYRSHRTRAYGIVEYDKKVLIVQNWLGSGAWSLPGGGGQNNEKFEETLARELHEETGIKINKKAVKIVIKGEHNREFGKKKFVIFHVPQATKPKVLINHLEIVASKWVDVEELHKVSPASYELKQVAKIYR